MASNSLLLELDRATDALIARHYAPPPAGAEPARLLEVAAQLRHLPSADFKSRLKAELLNPSRERVAGPRLVRETPAAILPTLSDARSAAYGMRGGNFAMSFAAHAAAVALIATSGVWMVQRQQDIKRMRIVSLTADVSPYVLPPAAKPAGGGGGGGDRDKMQASKGAPPKFAREQFAAPAIVLRNPEPKLAMEPTVVGPPDLKLSTSTQLGVSTASAFLPSNGTGSGGGIGNGTGGGLGNGFGPGVGLGTGGGVGGGAYRVGGGVSAPRAVYAPDPEYSEEARKAKYQGTVVLWCVVGPDGRVHDARVSRSLGMGLDQKAIEAVKTWRFTPSYKDGVPVAVQINIEVSFRLY